MIHRKRSFCQVGTIRKEALMVGADVLVVLPTLGDRLTLLEETLHSIALQRERVSLSIAVVVPKSALDARQLASSMGAKIVDDPGGGLSVAINAGLAARTTETYYAWVGDDDLFRPGGLHALQCLLDASPKAVLAFGGCDYIDDYGRRLAISKAGWIARFVLPWGPDLIPHPGTMIRLDALEDIGGFDEGLQFAMDLDAFLRLRSHGPFVWTRDSVSAFRWHSGSLTVANRLDSSREAEAVKRRHLPLLLRPLSGLWHRPVRWASSIAAKQISARAKSL